MVCLVVVVCLSACVCGPAVENHRVAWECRNEHFGKDIRHPRHSSRHVAHSSNWWRTLSQGPTAKCKMRGPLGSHHKTCRTRWFRDNVPTSTEFCSVLRGQIGFQIGTHTSCRTTVGIQMHLEIFQILGIRSLRWTLTERVGAYHILSPSISCTCG